jgi:hypothetical protein
MPSFNIASELLTGVVDAVVVVLVTLYPNMPSVKDGRADGGFSWRNFAVLDELRSEAVGSEGALNW